MYFISYSNFNPMTARKNTQRSYTYTSKAIAVTVVLTQLSVLEGSPNVVYPSLSQRVYFQRNSHVVSRSNTQRDPYRIYLFYSQICTYLYVYVTLGIDTVRLSNVLLRQLKLVSSTKRSLTKPTYPIESAYENKIAFVGKWFV